MVKVHGGVRQQYFKSLTFINIFIFCAALQLNKIVCTNYDLRLNLFYSKVQ